MSRWFASLNNPRVRILVHQPGLPDAEGLPCSGLLSSWLESPSGEVTPQGAQASPDLQLLHPGSPPRRDSLFLRVSAEALDLTGGE